MALSIKIVLCKLLGLTSCIGQTTTTVKAILLEQLRNTHSDQDWHIHLRKATQDLTAQQANWKDSTDNHSIGQLVSHLIFYNEQLLVAFQGNEVLDFTGENEETFQQLSDKVWDQAVRKIDSIQARWYELVEKATDEQIAKWGSTIVHMCSHIAYHTGQIIYIRKRNGWWKSV